MRCLVVGGSGQDGILISAQLLAGGHEVVSVSRSRSPLAMADHRTIDLLNPDGISELISDVKPERVFYLAAWHRSSEEPSPSLKVDLTSGFALNVTAFACLLDALERHAPDARTVYASSCRVFGRGDGSLLDESSPRAPVCAYGISKSAGMSVADIFRQNRGMCVSSAILFNHESELRGRNFLAKKLALAALAARDNPKYRVTVASLNDVADWGAARDYVAALRAIVEVAKPGDYVVATGQLRSVRELAEACFSAVGLDWTQHVDCLGAHASSGWRLAGSSRKLTMQTGWKPTLGFVEMVQDLLRRTEHHERQRSTDFHSYL